MCCAKIKWMSYEKGLEEENWGPDGQRRDSGKDPDQKCVSRGKVGDQGINSSSL